MSATPFCTEPSCTLANTRVLLEGTAPYPDGTGGLAYQFRLCDRCRLGFVHPTPTPQELDPFYTSDYTYYRAQEEQPGREASSLKYRLARLRYGHLTRPGRLGKWLRVPGALVAALAEVLHRKTVTFSLGVPLTLPRCARILDYGFGTGLWLRTLLHLGYTELAGYDIAANGERGRELAARGIDVYSDEDLARLPAASVDCIRLEHVFEHLVDPSRVLDNLYTWLRPGGLLVMNFPSIYAWLEIEDLPASPHLVHLQLPIHVAHHSVESATRLLRDAGFEGIHTRVTYGERFITVLARRPGGEASASP